MKKKGLIISTVVMVVVLIASLTTATYAWFTAEGSASVTQIGFTVASDSDLSIGVSANNTFKDKPGWAEFYSDNTVFSAPDKTNARGSWRGDTNGLGLTINTGLDLTTIKKAVYSFNNDANAATNTATAYEKGNGQKVTTGLARDKHILKANGKGSQVTGAYEATAMNGYQVGENKVTGDYLDVVFGVAASKNRVTGFGCLVTVSNTNGLASVGTSAALHAVCSTDGKVYKEIDFYGSYSSGTPITSMEAPVAPYTTIVDKKYNYKSEITTKKGDATLWIPLFEATAADTYAVTGEGGIKQLHLIIYLCGPDGDCTTSVEGRSTINIEFLSINSTTEAAA